MSNTMHPKNAIIKDHDGQIYSVVDILQGNTTALPDDTNNGMHPQNAIVMDADGTLHSLVDLLAGAGGGGGPVDPTSILDDTQALQNKTYSSSKIEEVVSEKVKVENEVADVNFSFDVLEDESNRIYIDQDWEVNSPVFNTTYEGDGFTVLFVSKNLLCTAPASAFTNVGAGAKIFFNIPSKTNMYIHNGVGNVQQIAVRTNSLNTTYNISNGVLKYLAFQRVGTDQYRLNVNGNESIINMTGFDLSQPDFRNLSIGNANLPTIASGGATVSIYNRTLTREEIEQIVDGTSTQTKLLNKVSFTKADGSVEEYSIGGGQGTSIDDATPSLESTYSSTKIETLIQEKSQVGVEGVDIPSFSFTSSLPVATMSEQVDQIALQQEVMKYINVPQADGTTRTYRIGYDLDDQAVQEDTTYSSQKIEDLFSRTQKVKTLSYAFTNYVVYGEKGRPAQQGFIETQNGEATINMVEDIVFGQSQTVIEVNDNAGGGSISGFDKELTTQDMTDLKAFPSITYGTSKLQAIDGELGFFLGLQDQDTGNRYGLTFTANNAPLTVTALGTPNINFVCDGLEGRPFVQIGDWFKWALKIDAMGQNASFYINGQLTTLQPTFSAGGSGTSRLTVQSGSSGGVDRITRHAELGVVIMKEALTKQINEEDVNGSDVVQIIVPPAPFDLIIAPSTELLPRAVGTQIFIPLANVGGTITLQGNENFIVNNLASSTIPVTNNGILTAINRTDNSNDYILSIALEPTEEEPGLNIADIIDDVNADNNKTYSSIKIESLFIDNINFSNEGW